MAGQLGEQWGNPLFPALEPRVPILNGVARHDDAWVDRDAQPCLTAEGKPSAFSRELVGTYDAFEEIDLKDYLAIRGQATEEVAGEDPYAAVLISMHTLNLLTEQADLSKLTGEQRVIHSEFVRQQRERQQALLDSLATGPLSGYTGAETLNRAFKFLQACDSLSLTACVRYPKPIALRHEHPTANGVLKKIVCTPMGLDTYRLDPYPFNRPELTFEVPIRPLTGKSFESEADFRTAYREAPRATMRIRIVA